LVIDIQFIQGRAKHYLVDDITEEWVKNSKDKAVAGILQETQEHEACEAVFSCAGILRAE
jgi:hypothetical protein